MFSSIPRIGAEAVIVAMFVTVFLCRPREPFSELAAADWNALTTPISSFQAIDSHTSNDADQTKALRALDWKPGSSLKVSRDILIGTLLFYKQDGL